MAMPQRTRSKCDAGSLSVAALFAACRGSQGGPCGLRRQLREALELLPEKRRVGLIGRREMGPEADELHTVVPGGRLDERSDVAGVALPEPAHPGVELDVHPRRPPQGCRARATARGTLAPHSHVGVRGQGEVELVRGERAHREQPRARQALRAAPPPRRPSPLRATRSARDRRARAFDRAVPIAVRLDDRTQRRALRETRARGVVQLRSTAPALITALARETPAASLTRAPPASAATTSVAITESAEPSRRAAMRPAAPCARTPAQAAANGSIPRASSAPMVPESTSPVPAVASIGLPPGLIASALAVGHDRVIALEHDDGVAALGRLARGGEPVGVDLAGIAPEQPPQFARMRRQDRRAARARRATRVAPACALSPSASIRSGASTRSASARASASESSSRPRPGPSTTRPRAPPAAARIASASLDASLPSRAAEAASTSPRSASPRRSAPGRRARPTVA